MKGQLLKNKYLPFLLCFIIMSVFLSLLYAGWGDDVYFKTCNGLGFWEFIDYQFHIKSRIILDILLVSVLQLPQPVWGILTGALFALTAYLISYFFSDCPSDETGWLTILLLLIYRFSDMNEAGWFATTVNYIWPLAFGLIALIPIKNAVSGKKEKIYMYPIYIFSLLIGTNEEQMAAILVGFFFIFAGYLYKEKKLTKFIALEAMISVLVLAFMAFGPSNQVRIKSEAEVWFPQFLELNIMDKCYLGVTTTAMDLLFTNNYLAMVFVLLLPVFIYKLSQNDWIRGLSLIPAVLLSINNLFHDFFVKLCPELGNITVQLRAGRTFFERAENFTLPVYYSTTMLLVSALVFLPPLVCAFATLKGNRKWLVSIVLLAGYASRFMIGLSPTCIGGGMRTAYFLYMAMVTFLVMLFEECKERVDLAKLFCAMSTIAVLQLTQLKYLTSLIK